MESKKTLVLAVLDGWGYSKYSLSNAIHNAKTPYMDEINAHYPMTLLQASGLAVGLAWGEPGNSEVGHLNMGAGRIIQQYLSRINKAIEDKSFAQNEAIIGVFEHAKAQGSTIHMIGLLTSGAVHASFAHLVALLDIAVGYPDVPLYLHLFTDGKDSGLQEGAGLLTRLQGELDTRHIGTIVSVIGRKIAMDRDNHWDYTKEAYDLLTEAKGEASDDIIASVKAQYAQDQNDQKMLPIVNGKIGFKGIMDNDAILFFNFREDAIRQIVRPFVEANFDKFARKALANTYVCTLTEYLEHTSAHIAFPPPVITNGLAEAVSNAGKLQLHITETEKYAHVTYFFDGLRNEPFPGETQELVETIKDFEGNPAMRSADIVARVIEVTRAGLYDLIVVNFPNADILAHTGNINATIAGIEAVDIAVGLLQQVILDTDGTLIITADHGNAERLTYSGTGERETRHDDSPIPFYLIGRQYRKAVVRDASQTPEIQGIIADIAPTILALMAIPQPAEMTGTSLLSVLS